MGRNVGTAQNHSHAIGYFRKEHYAVGPMREMFRLPNITKGDRREKGHARRKLQVTTDGINHVYIRIDWRNPDSVTSRCTISISWLFMMRAGEYIGLV